ncbi:hypothetical protein D9619_000197 [Psilocybe cf. subviscida]|uniref:Uncharacterized protein n=1 Tax=Psilocybe cf. subviscida TaxID=2480587 RepID=A0A8H5F2L0_9AGAR|nr:hypothetical protein D9619_000197 [Psilocybe cf. subviscida]
MSKPTPHVGVGTMCWHSGSVGYEWEGGLASGHVLPISTPHTSLYSICPLLITSGNHDNDFKRITQLTS